MTCEMNSYSACVVEALLILPGQPLHSQGPGGEGKRYADFAISMIDLILDDSVPKCLREIISLATEQLLNTRNC